MHAPAGPVSARLADPPDTSPDEPAPPPTPVALVSAAPPPLTPYARSERLFRYVLAGVFSLMLIVLVVVGALLLLGH